MHIVNGKGGKQRTAHTPKARPRGSRSPSSWREGRVISSKEEIMGISTRQIQRLLDEAAEKAGLQETRPGRVRQRKRITPHLLRYSFSRWSLDAGIDIYNNSWDIPH
jgi:site-specific recombinase XerD